MRRHSGSCSLGSANLLAPRGGRVSVEQRLDSVDLLGEVGLFDLVLAARLGRRVRPPDSIVYTTGPNCLDYQRWLEQQGYTVKQRDG